PHVRMGLVECTVSTPPSSLAVKIPQKIQSTSDVFCYEEKQQGVQEGISKGYGCELSGVRDDEAGGIR
ncbi:MAG: hypothetical protein IJC24_06985, partial [Clostridia bacterium]|nr:hypothetical protein [Clostridia bacterium]